ncbi:MAG: ADP-ribose pyrophosphatase [Candidatus Marinimicrobia bacterium]|nr:ADP-ribose pyrophosphatase [Candidatus Neomarinimicrobiota bacterium]|tara:strand:- start:312 stop:857 length:546 start_codon:yes stop_codon:yes gene_type:complete
MSKLKETKVSSKKIFKGHLLDVRQDLVLLPNGEKAVREWINHPGAVVIIPILPDGLIGLIRQYRYAVKSEFIELPAGKLDFEEKASVCAFRELKEEIGYETRKLTFLTNIHPAIGFTNEVMSIFLAENLKQVDRNLDDDEFLELLPTSLEDALEMVWNGKITDVKTIIGILWLSKLIKEKI